MLAILAAPGPDVARAANDGEVQPQLKNGRENMRSGIELIKAFVAAFNRKDIDGIMAFFTPDAVYHNMPTQPVTGLEQIRGVIEHFVAPAESLDWEILAIAETGSTVLAERLDRFVINGKPVELPVTGVFELEGGKIKVWRDYFDAATWQRQTQD
ncbi:MAG: limonene-1,2-epoxide hydrolase family protein [Methyloligellaceae bacterium]